MTDSEDTGMRGRQPAPGQRTSVWVAATRHEEPELFFETGDLLLEAPNWAHDGRSLLLNGDGLLWRLDAAHPAGLEPVPLAGVPPINNDHVLSPDGGTVYVSAMDGHLYAAPAAGGAGTRLTEDDGTLHYLHGVSPDGLTLAYVSIPIGAAGAPGRLALMPSSGGRGRVVEAGEGHLDGPEYTPDGAWIYVNSETFTTAPGHAQIARVPASGGPVERVHASDTVDWFPHLSPDGRHAVYVEFPAGTLGHPENLDVTVRLVRTDAWAAPLRSYPVFGGQGTMNVNSWAPDGDRFAFVSYSRV